MEDQNRRTGRTTRLVDEAIQTIFTKGTWTARDHYDDIHAHRTLFQRVMDRLNREHNFSYYLGKGDLSLGVSANAHNLTITWRVDTKKDA